MGKIKSEERVKKVKKEKKSKHSGVHKKSKKAASPELQEEESEDEKDTPMTNGALVKAENGDEDMEVERESPLVIPQAALVPFANPLADEKQTKKVLRAVKKGTGYSHLPITNCD
jgi:H/ACA ribonucleoprotein complex subunit 2